MTNQFTDEQMKSALDAFVGGDFFAEYPQSVAYWEPRMRAALEAAAGVSPQAGNLERLEEATNTYVREVSDVPFRLSVIENWNEHVRGMRAALATPVQPSSTVDEGKLAELIQDRHEVWEVARTDLTRSQFIARAVVEAIGGEG